MKHILPFFLLLTNILFAQSPQGFKYQAVVRDNTGALTINQIISIRTSILIGSTSGNSVYQETQTVATNDYGVVSITIGQGTLVSGSFTTINWGANTYFIKTELDLSGGSNYQFMGVSQVMAVPYAMYADQSKIATADHDTSSTNELQTLSVNGRNINISSGNTILTPPDEDHDTTNELQTLSLHGDSLKISKGNSIFMSTKVPQALSLTYDTSVVSLYISGNNHVNFPKDNDHDSTNEIQSLSISGKTIAISKANSIMLNDNDSTNELQNLSIQQGTIAISKGNTIHLPDSSATNELQNLSYSNDTLSISNGNSIYISGSSFDFPHGYSGTLVYFDPNQTVTYTVPNGYVLYVISALTTYISINNINYYTSTSNQSMLLPPVFNSGSTLNIQTGAAPFSGLPYPSEQLHIRAYVNYALG